MWSWSRKKSQVRPSRLAIPQCGSLAEGGRLTAKTVARQGRTSRLNQKSKAFPSGRGGKYLPLQLRLLEDAGCACAAFHDANVRNLRVTRAQCDEVWLFVYAKRNN